MVAVDEWRTYAVRSLLEQFVLEAGDDPIPWIVLPASSVHESRGWELRRVSDVSIPPHKLLGLLRRSDRVARARPSQSARFYLAGGFLFEADGVNHWRTLEPIMNEVGGAEPIKQITPGRLRVARLTRQAVALADRFLRTARDRDVWIYETPADLRLIFAAGARFLAHAEAMIEAVEPKAAVIPTPPALPARALVTAARARGVPSVYFPHASTLSDIYYNDLPVDFAGLWGEQEKRFYIEWGADPERLVVIGNPSMPVLPLVEIDHSAPALFAPPIAPRERMAPLFELVEAVLGDDVIVSPHPRADVSLLRSIASPAWKFWERRTLELLEQGPPLVVLQSGGIAMEALRLGIPTVNLTMPGRPESTYAVIREPYVPTAASEADLRAAVESSRRVAASTKSRAALRDWAEGWSESIDDAPARAARLLRRAVREGPKRQPLIDAWRNPAFAREVAR